MRHLVVTAALLFHFIMAESTDHPITQASNSFASKLYQELAKTPGNVLVCPVSVHIALALVHQGAGSTTKSQLADVLHLPGSNNDIKNSYKELLTALQDTDLKTATKLFPAISFSPKQEYVTVAREYFLSDVQPLDFSKADDAAKTINTFVENKTNNKIHDIIKSDSLSDLTRLVIVNAVHFKAGWAKTFPPAYIDTFKVSPSQSIKTEFISQTDQFNFMEDFDLDAKILKLDYKNRKYSMVFVLPNKVDGLPELEAKLATIPIDTLLSGLARTRVDVTIPKFKIEQEIQLKDHLVKLGITHLFDSRADLSDLATGENLFVDSVIQKSFISVNENGTEAAAATGVVTPLSGGTEEFTFVAQRPFHFYLINDKTRVILFNGRLVKPEEINETPATLSSNNPTNIQGNSNGGTDGGFNRFGNEQNPFSNGQVIGMNPSLNYGQNIKQPNVPVNYGQASQNNRFNQNRYPQPPSPQSNYDQYNQPGFSQSHNVGQNSPAAPQHNPNSYHQAGHQTRGQFAQPAPQQTFVPSQPSWTQYNNEYQQPRTSSHHSNNYESQYDADGYRY